MKIIEKIKQFFIEEEIINSSNSLSKYVNREINHLISFQKRTGFREYSWGFYVSERVKMEHLIHELKKLGYKIKTEVVEPIENINEETQEIEYGEPEGWIITARW